MVAVGARPTAVYTALQRFAVLLGLGRAGESVEELRAAIQQFADLGFDEIHVHNVGRNQEQFIKAFGEQVIARLR